MPKLHMTRPLVRALTATVKLPPKQAEAIYLTPEHVLRKAPNADLRSACWAKRVVQRGTGGWKNVPLGGARDLARGLIHGEFSLLQTQ
jgi:hypothetical protein